MAGMGKALRKKKKKIVVSIPSDKKMSAEELQKHFKGAKPLMTKEELEKKKKKKPYRSKSSSFRHPMNRVRLERE